MPLSTTVTARRANLIAVFARKAARNGIAFSLTLASECTEAAGLAEDALTDRQRHRCQNIARKAIEDFNHER